MRASPIALTLIQNHTSGVAGFKKQIDCPARRLKYPTVTSQAGNGSVECVPVVQTGMIWDYHSAVMTIRARSSRLRFTEYSSRLKGRRKGAPAGSDITPGRSRRRQRSFLTLFREFLGLIRGHRRILALALISLTISTSLGLMPLYATKIIFDNVLSERSLPLELPAFIRVPQDRRQLLAFLAVGIVGMTTLSLFFSIWGRWQATRITKRVQVSARRMVFEHAMRLPLHRVYALKSGGVASMLREDAGGIAELVFAMLYNPWRAITQLVGSLLILVVVDWRLLIGAVVLIPLIFMIHRAWISGIRPIHRDIRASRQAIDSHATETFGGMRVVRSFSRQRSETGRFTRDNDFMARQEILAWWKMRGIDLVWSMLIPLASAVMVWYGGMRILHDRELVDAGLLNARQALTVGDLVMFLSYLVALLSPLEMLATSATTFQNSLAGLDRVLDLLGEPVEMPSRPGAMVIDADRPQRGAEPAVAGRITFRDVSFNYPGSETKVIQHVNLDVQPGQIVAFIGPSGAGKTTLCNLIARFYDPTEGAILLDGTDLRDIEINSYRRLLGIVEQDTFLFDGTITENIGYGRRDASMDEIIEAARRANAHEFIEKLPQEYDTFIGERGIKLSGGQRQRLTIARAILADPRILILDEATSNLDTQSERLIQISLHTLMAGRTSFVIAHRLSTIAHADRIVVLENGRIVEQGHHDELMQQSGRYRKMVELQTQPTAAGLTSETPAVLALDATRLQKTINPSIH